MEGFRQFVLEGVQHQPEIWSNLKGQIYLGTAAFVTEIAAQHKDCKTAIIAAYKTGEYNTAKEKSESTVNCTQRRLGLFFVKIEILDI
ncbi:MAG: hypothetical protein U1D41_13580 [Nitrosomonas sp.]|uniref:hypothetical protein n=1 Tax=Nitrosomonas sp. TaxID=42353 RepID=UPI002732846A|nr:hypothetical protein [Nitrosomonas sp.]MDP3663750.1 hypothetical protein [Nitrosomonas sp.]MDZ4107159.1 hypothetical protein [Nitrosomonas sp.]